MNKELNKLENDIIKQSQIFNDVTNELHKVIVGQNNLIEKLLISLICNGHILLEGVPGLAKTLTIQSLSQLLDTNYQRIQFTPDLLPADLIGTLIYNMKDAKFEVKKGPIFTNIILADEINRSPAKVQSALLEAMQENQVTIGDKTYQLDDPFLVMATQNPIEQEGTYPLPEAQVDRFMFKVIVDYPNVEEELKILKRMSIIDKNKKLKSILKIKDIKSSRKLVQEIHISKNIEKYIVSIIHATRFPKEYKLKDLDKLISFGSSPRGTIYLSIASKARAFFEKRTFVIPQDVRYVIKDVLRHRLILSYEAEAEELTTEDLIDRIVESIPTP